MAGHSGQLQAIDNNYEKIVLSTDSLISFNSSKGISSTSCWKAAVDRFLIGLLLKLSLNCYLAVPVNFMESVPGFNGDPCCF
ncbi:hypothetical protein SpiBuddy_0598 [Sphaerochaeta globosa str. Buddy]|uniref:Uncharacterized protein n=1 Tax=Sphaerochaeta globosa (strain ATCC BAA-1886 / DSM 22777 / Buddy) TaxID=158189 RepID=F0RY05_SPHGB|nr:hypothetical protein SpiBuddy_0598 [Sphaerochaeta globosa str. Buddy]